MLKKKHQAQEKNSRKNTAKKSRELPQKIRDPIPYPILLSTRRKTHLPGPPFFSDPVHTQSGPVTGSFVLVFRNGARNAPGLGSADPLFDRKLLVDVDSHQT